VLRRFEADGRRAEDLPLLHWTMSYVFAQVQVAFEGIYGNLTVPGLTWFFAGPVRWLLRINPIGHLPADRLDAEVAALGQLAGAQRERLFDQVFIPTAAGEAYARLENAFRLTLESEEVSTKVRRAVRAKKLAKKPVAELYRDAVAAGVITQAEFEVIDRAEKARWDAIQVDDYGLQEYQAFLQSPESARALEAAGAG
jgi:acyl-CoA dehydrogenase